MNSILQNRQQQMQPRNFKEFASLFTPETAKQELEKQLRQGTITPQQLEQAKQITNSILNR